MAKTPAGRERESGTPAGMKKSLKKAITEMLILFFLKQRPMYTYEIAQFIYQLSEGVLTFNTLYLAIYRLAEHGYIIEDRKIVSDDNRVRVYFSITPEGLEYLSQITKEYNRVIMAVNNMLALDGKINDILNP